MCAAGRADGLEVEETDSTLVITGTQGAGFRVTFDKGLGTIVSFTAGSSTLLDTAGPLPNLWRAPTDNDEGGGSNSFASAWITMGLRTCEMSDIRFSYVVDDVAGAVVVSVSASLPVLIPAGSFEYTSTYAVKANADIDMSFRWVANPNRGEFPALPRVGVQFLTPKSANQISWYGRGPFER